MTTPMGHADKAGEDLPWSYREQARLAGWAIAWNVSHETDWGAQARRAKAELVGVVEGETTARRGEEKA